mgnify:CR=1 FL=1
MTRLPPCAMPDICSVSAAPPPPPPPPPPPSPPPVPDDELVDSSEVWARPASAVVDPDPLIPSSSEVTSTVPAEMVTASGSGLDPDISPRGAQAQVRRVAEARGLDIATVRHLVDSLTQKPWLGLFGTAKVNVLRLNIALETLQPNVTASAGVRQAGGCGEDVSPEN